MVWSLDNDDFAGRCQEGRYPLLTAVDQAMREWEFGYPSGNALGSRSSASLGAVACFFATVGSLLVAFGVGRMR